MTRSSSVAHGPDRTASSEGARGSAAVDDEEAEPTTCEYCDRQFTTDRRLALHRGHRHGDRLSPSERTAYRTAYERESERLRRYRLKAVAALVVLYFGFLFAFAVFG